MLYYVMLYDAVLCYILYLIIPYMIERLYYTVCMYTYVYIYIYICVCVYLMSHVVVLYINTYIIF